MSTSPDMDRPAFAPHDRLLVFAPHPDDETLATGCLMQRALAGGAAVRVVFATDGDNNPWPQRWLERRWRIGPAERARWGIRRRDEAREALARLGGGAIEARFLGWPDQGLTAMLMTDDGPVGDLAAQIGSFAPTVIALPLPEDRHPDHSALHVLLRLALRRGPDSSRLLGYAVHRGRSLPDATDAGPMARRKLDALAAYRSQLALSRGRLLGMAQRPELLVALAAAVDPVARAGIELRMGRRAEELLLVRAVGHAVWRWRGAVPPAGKRRCIGPGETGGVEVVREGNRIRVADTGEVDGPVEVWAKLHRRDPRLFVFDRAGWQACVRAGRGAELRQGFG